MKKEYTLEEIKNLPFDWRKTHIDDLQELFFKEYPKEKLASLYFYNGKFYFSYKSHPFDVKKIGYQFREYVLPHRIHILELGDMYRGNFFYEAGAVEEDEARNAGVRIIEIRGYEKK